jgi:hypothetical protein
MLDYGYDPRYNVYQETVRMNDKVAKEVYIKGPVIWAKVFERNRDYGNEEVPLDAKFNGRYSIGIGVDKEMTKTIKKWNRLYSGKLISEMNSKSKDLLHDISEEYGDDLRFFTFWRNHTHAIKNGDVIDAWGGPPVVVDKANFAWDSEVNIGNGSMCTIKLSVSTAGNKTYVRLEGVRIEDLVEFEGEKTEVEVENHSDGLPF